MRILRVTVSALMGTAMLAACGTNHEAAPRFVAPEVSSGVPIPSSAATPSATPSATPTHSKVPALPRPGNPDGHAGVPAEAGAVDTSHPDHVIGSGT
ncbi:MAG TPA: hypothetical protein VH502_08020, partial [Actinoplanes sp.]